MRAHVPEPLEAGLVGPSELADAGMLQTLTSAHWRMRLGHLVTRTNTPSTLN